MNTELKLILMGTGPFAVPTFGALWEAGFPILAVVTRPVPPAVGRRPGAENPVLAWATPTGLPLLTPEDINAPAACGQLAALAADLLVVCDYGRILSSEALASTRLGGVNLHGSLLPRYRGAAPVNWCLWRGDPKTGVSVIHMTPRLDAGPILAMRRTAIKPQEDAVALEPRLALLGVEAVREAIATLAAWDGQSALGTPQDEQTASRAPRLRKGDGQVDWAQPAARICNQVRALKPWPGTYTAWTGPKRPLRLILDSVAVVPPPERAAAELSATGPPGSVVRSDAGGLWVQTGDGVLAIQRVQPAGKRVLEIAEFLRGNPIPVAAQLGEFTS